MWQVKLLREVTSTDKCARQCQPSIENGDLVVVISTRGSFIKTNAAFLYFRACTHVFVMYKLRFYLRNKRQRRALLRLFCLVGLPLSKSAFILRFSAIRLMNISKRLRLFSFDKCLSILFKHSFPGSAVWLLHFWLSMNGWKYLVQQLVSTTKSKFLKVQISWG